MAIGTTPRKKSTPPEFLPVGLSLSNPRVVQEEYRDEVSKIGAISAAFVIFAGVLERVSASLLTGARRSDPRLYLVRAMRILPE
jgi:hypothetical protein